MPPQIVRLVLLTVGIVGTYVVARSFLKPASFGEYGHYRGAALGEIARREPVYAGWKACDECHSDTLQLAAKGMHKTIGCESCHGPARAHAGNPDVKLATHDNTLCLRCHEAAVARPASQKQITVKDHYSSDHCWDCHLPHNPTEAPP